jgi:hypothetical protein
MNKQYKLVKKEILGAPPFGKSQTSFEGGEPKNEGKSRFKIYSTSYDIDRKTGGSPDLIDLTTPRVEDNLM